MPEILRPLPREDVENVGVEDVTEAVLGMMAHFIADRQVTTRGDIAHPIYKNAAQRIGHASPFVTGKKFVHDKIHPGFAGNLTCLQ